MQLILKHYLYQITNLGYWYDQCGDYDNSFYYYLKAIEKGDIVCAVDNIICLIDEYKIDEAERENAYRTVLEVVPKDSRILDKIKE